MSVYGLKVWKMAALEAGRTPASRHVWEGHQWERDPHPPFPLTLLTLSSIPVPCRAAAVSLLGPSGQLLTRCVGSSTRELDSREQLRANTLFPECQRGFGW